MNKLKLLVVMFLSLSLLTGCGQTNIKDLAENVKKIELTGNLVTYQAYYHNVIEYDKKAPSGFTHIFEKDRKLFAEYTGTIKLGINLSKVKVEVHGNEINAFIPKATIIGEPNVSEDDFKSENFIEDEDSFINKNPLTIEDSSKAFDKAQEEMKNLASTDTELLAMAQKRAKVVIEENIKQFSGLNEGKYTINWEYEQ